MSLANVDVVGDCTLDIATRLSTTYAVGTQLWPYVIFPWTTRRAHAKLSLQTLSSYICPNFGDGIVSGISEFLVHLFIKRPFGLFIFPFLDFILQHIRTLDGFKMWTWKIMKKIRWTEYKTS